MVAAQPVPFVAHQHVRDLLQLLGVLTGLRRDIGSCSGRHGDIYGIYMGDIGATGEISCSYDTIAQRPRGVPDDWGREALVASDDTVMAQ